MSDEAAGESPPTRDPFAGPDWDEKTAPTLGPDGQPLRRRVRVNRRKRRRRRRIAIGMMIVGGLILLAGAWLVVTGLMARHELALARADVRVLRGQISAGDLAAARNTESRFARDAHRAHALTTGPVWALAASLPAGGEPLHTVRGVTAGIDMLGNDALPQLVRASALIDPAKIRNADGSINLADIADAAPSLDHASATMTEAAAQMARLPRVTWLHSIDAARTDVANQLDGLRRQVESASVAADVAPEMLGSTGPKRYFVAFQNEAEARGTGGLPGAFAIVEANRGKLRFIHFESDVTLDGVAANVDFGAAYRQLYDGANTTTDYRNSNLSPNFPYAAQVWVSMWQRYSGERLDGAMAIDPTALSYLLHVTGPLVLRDHTVVSAGNVVALTQSVVYAKYPFNNTARREYLLAIASSVSQDVVAAKGSSAALVRAGARAAGERRLLIWSADPRVEARLAMTTVGGAVPTTTAPYVGLSIVNDAGTKLDYYLDRRVSWQRQGCGTRVATKVTISLTNNAPLHGLPTYVTGRSDVHSYPTKPGDNRLEVSYLATSGASMASVEIDGKAGAAAIGLEHGHPVYTVDLELPVGATRTIVLNLVEPNTAGPPIVLRQPLVLPLTVSLEDARCV